MNIKRGRITAIMTLLLSVLAVFASLLGIMDKNLYNDVLKAGTITKFLVTGSIAQDIISVPLGIILAVLSIIFLKCSCKKTFIVMLGLAGYFFYGYGLYTMQGQYTSIYQVYLIIFGLSLYSLILGLTCFNEDTVKNYQLSKGLQIAISAFLFMIVIVLTPLWLGFSSGDIAKHIPRDTYAVFVFDLSIVFPALAITAVMLLRNIRFGNILAGVALIKAFTVCLSVGFGELFQAYYAKLTPNYGGIIIFSILSVISLILTVLYLINSKRESIT